MKKNRPLIILWAVFTTFSSCSEKRPTKKTIENSSITFDLPEGFVLEDLYRPSLHEQGSWVALTQGPDDLIFACDQYGKIYRFKAPKAGKTLKKGDVRPLDLQIGEAHGLLWAHNSLYVAVNKGWKDDIPDNQEKGSGVYRITDSDNDSELDKVDMLMRLEGSGEHGPHSFVTSPNQQEIYFIAGNHTLVPEQLKKNSRLPTNWGEDNLFIPYLDARGHANDIKAPGGWIAKFNAEGTDWQLISAGFRNAFDFAFNDDGELFTYDADMEWDIGMPWYRPTRICHVTSGSEFGWRTGSGKWPEYYGDGLPATLNMAQGSPTAVLAGRNLNFPEKYKNGLLVMDWSFGTIYFIKLMPKGSSYTAERSEFLSGTPLPLTDMIAGADGHLYFATGGRRIDSHLFRLRYTGDDISEAKNTTNAKAVAQRKLREDIEAYHAVKTSEAIPLAWKHLDHKDRFIRYASRIALEHQPIDQWADLFFEETKPKKIIEASMGMARQADARLQSKILAKLNAIPLEGGLPLQQQLNMLRAYELLFIRMGEPTAKDRATTVKKLKPFFPHTNNAINRELGQLLLFLNSDGIIKDLVTLLEKHTQEKTISEGLEMLSEKATLRSEQYGPLIREVIAKMPPSEAIHYGLLLSNAERGWTKALREKYFMWFYDVLGAKGGMSFKAYMENVRRRAMTHVPDEEKNYFKEISGVYSPSSAIADLPNPIGPGSNYTKNEMNDMVKHAVLENYNGTFEDGKRAYEAARCILCHRMRGEGGAAGPDLTKVYSKFSSHDIVHALYSPNDEISDQYAHTLLHLKNGKKMAGRIIAEEGDSLQLAPNPFNQDHIINIAKNEVTKRELSPVSPMPSTLLNFLNKKEVLDLFAYMKAEGDENHELYQGNRAK